MNKSLQTTGSAPTLGAMGYEFDADRRIWKRPEQEAFAYSDGDDVEQRIHAAIESCTDVSVFSQELRKHQTDWPSVYHLSPVRANLLRPVSKLFTGARILEIGAGCGAITRYLGEQGANVLALEGSPRRASIAAARCRDLPNITVLCERFGEFSPDERFDVISLIGVLEYARLYAGGEDPVQETLRKALSLLSDDGVLLIAIENQLGLKYFAGVHEDHLGRAMAGIQDHYDPAGVVTFGKGELEARLLRSGFASAQFALPFPDYKLPQCVVLPRGYADDNGFNAASLAGQATRADRQLQSSPLFAMGPAFGVLGRNGLLADLSNSFLVLAGKSAGSPTFDSLAPSMLAAQYSSDRQPAFVKATRFVAEDGGILVKRDHLCPDAAPSTAHLVTQVLDGEIYLRGTNWVDRLNEILSREGWTCADIAQWLIPWQEALVCVAGLPLAPHDLDLDTQLPGNLIDAVPRNLILTDSGPRFFDLEWTLRAPLTFGYMAYRAIGVSLAGVSGIASPNDPALLHVPTLIRAVLRQLGLLVTASHLQHYLDYDSALHDEVTGRIDRPLSLAAFDGYQLKAMPDVTKLLRDFDNSHAQSVTALIETDATVTTLRLEHEFLSQELTAKLQHVAQLEKAVGDTEQALAAALGDNERLHQLEVQSSELTTALDDVTQKAAQLEASNRALELRSSELTVALGEATHRATELETSNVERGAEIHRLWRLIEGNPDAETDQAGLLHQLNHALTEASRYRHISELQDEELNRVKNSMSWAITAPARMVTGAGRSVLGSTRVRLAQIVEGVYRKLPLDQRRKQQLKGFLFRSSGGLLRNTRAYQRWQAFERINGSFPGVQSAGRHQVLNSTVPANENGLWEADGIREWAEYQPLRDRIIGGAQLLREQQSPKAMDVLDFSNKKVARVASQISLPGSPEIPDVTILIPVYNHLVTTLECLASIAATANDGPSFEIIIADDASSDETAEVLATIPNLRVVSQPQNLGFLRNCNTAAQTARGRNLLLLNNDVQVTEGWLAAMLACLESDPSVGAVGPRIVYPNGWLQEAGARLKQDGTAEMIGLNESPELPRFAYTREVDYCSGACLLVRTADFAALGGFDDRYAPAYCEDSDLCMRLRASGKRVMYCAGAEVIHHLSKTSNDLNNDYKLACISRNLQTFTSTWQDRLDAMDTVRTIAFYLPQFHPIPENDLWWGRGFTEWTNVTKARPNFVGHYQPRVPADLGYYDLRLADVMKQQAELAKRYGVHGFCFYYYWFAGQRLLERPIEQMLADDNLDMPFCLCWANENWTRRWDGQENEVLMAQRHSPEDDLAVIHDLMRYFASPNYIRVNGKPLLLVYRVALFPDFAKTAQVWRETCRAAGIGEIYLAQVESFELTAAGIKPEHFGCDAAVEFPPHGMAETYPLEAPLLNPDFQGAVADYRDLAVRYATRPFPDYKRFQGVIPGWDNTARRQNNSYAFEEATPGAFQAWLETTIARTKQQYCGDERLVFINAWNEWAEGAYLEPDRRFGHTFLEGVRNALDASKLMRHDSYSLGD